MVIVVVVVIVMVMIVMIVLVIVDNTSHVYSMPHSDGMSQRVLRLTYVLH